MDRMRIRVIIVALLLVPSVLVGQTKTPQDVWQLFKFFVVNGKESLRLQSQERTLSFTVKVITRANGDP
ncbi:MAG TPA: hypothetical protein VJ124_11750 [Pyrinomonadaceae bacterium]|nr:hypothetical protein [Pyrinomonadaceae bacterium]